MWNYTKYKTEVFIMTRGHIKFSIQDTTQHEPEQIMMIGISSDAYPSYTGAKIYDALKTAIIDAGVSVERIFLRAFGKWESDYYLGDEYIYNVILKPYLIQESGAQTLLEVAHIEVSSNFTDGKKIIFSGGHEAFKSFCNSDDE